MASEEAVLAGAMAGYERARLRRAVIAALPTLVLPLVAFALGGRLVPSVVLGAALATLVIALGWRGQAWGRAVPAGLLAGLFPLGLALTAQRIGHVCTPEGCTSLCVPMCSAGGLIAGVVISLAARRSTSPRLTLGAGAVVTLVVGALGCSCVGYAGALGMMAGLAVTASIGALLPRRAR